MAAQKVKFFILAANLMKVANRRALLRVRAIIADPSCSVSEVQATCQAGEEGLFREKPRRLDHESDDPI